jgi:2,5-diketo-D-gluconate reductase A
MDERRAIKSHRPDWKDLMTSAQVPVLTLNNGVAMPAIGLGVFQNPPEETAEAVQSALTAGYRHIDTAAAAYGNEREVGEGIRRSGTDRADIFIETKEAYQALERLLPDGKVRAIGVSNFMPEHLRQLLDASGIVPAVNQVELHPYFTQPDVQKADAEHGILTQAWSPIGGITFYRGTGKSTLQDPAILAIACAHELDVLDALDTGVRGGPEPASFTLKDFGRPIPEA